MNEVARSKNKKTAIAPRVKLGRLQVDTLPRRGKFDLVLSFAGGCFVIEKVTSAELRILLAALEDYGK